MSELRAPGRSPTRPRRLILPGQAERGTSADRRDKTPKCPATAPRSAVLRPLPSVGPGPAHHSAAAPRACRRPSPPLNARLARGTLFVPRRGGRPGIDSAPQVTATPPVGAVPPRSGGAVQPGAPHGEGSFAGVGGLAPPRAPSAAPSRSTSRQVGVVHAGRVLPLHTRLPVRFPPGAGPGR